MQNRQITRNGGFTIIELLIVVAIIGILAAIALPAYSEYMVRGRLVEAHAVLAGHRVKMEQFYQDNRTYVGACAAGSIAATPAATGTFAFACSNLTADTYTITATGAGSAAGFAFTIDEANVRKTTGVPAGWTQPGSNCWVLKKAGTCS